MKGKFVTATDAKHDIFEWGELAWFSSPGVSAARNLVVVEASFKPGAAHAFHKHPRQEEVLYVLDGVIEQWVGEEKRTLKAGDSAFIPADVVHASFNTTGRIAKLLAILGPSIGEEGYELVDMVDQPPWNRIRSA